MCHFLAPAGQPEMMHKNFMHWHVRIFAAQHSHMKFYEGMPYKNTMQPIQGRNPSEKGKNQPFFTGNSLFCLERTAIFLWKTGKPGC